MARSTRRMNSVADIFGDVLRPEIRPPHPWPNKVGAEGSDTESPINLKANLDPPQKRPPENQR